MQRKPVYSQPKVRSKVAQESFLRSGAGKHGGSKRTRNRKDRANAKRDLRSL